MSKTSRNKYEFMKDWDKFSMSRTESAVRHPILMPINLDIVDGRLVRTRMKAPDVKKLYAKCRNEFPDYMQKAPKLFDNPDKIFKEYVNFFQNQDGVEGPGDETALDLNCIHPTWMLFNLPRRNWEFTRGVQYSVINDMDCQQRNFEKICTLNGRRSLILSNRCRSMPKGLKFNLHVTMTQKENGKTYKTPIIIDPPVLNDPIPPFGGIN
jgi:hypothetical protein